jgi:thymidylate synthase (FAD)
MVRLVSITPHAEQTMGYCARVSNPKNQDNPDVSKLLRYCAEHGHWSVFEMANAVVEITTSRAIAAQILRHRSFNFQEFSQRYAEPTTYVSTEARRQDDKNRQNSIDDLPHETKMNFAIWQEEVWALAKQYYDAAIEQGVAKECARMLLPLNTQTTLYMNGTIRSWIHYLKARTHPSAQLEHRQLALQVQDLLSNELPVVAEAMGWREPR